MGDLHGRHYQRAARLIWVYKPDWIILVGDILPDFSMVAGRHSRLEAQRLHWQTYHRCFEAEGACTLFVCGNHEIEGFVAPEHQCIPPALAGRVLCLEGVPAEFGAFGFAREKGPEDLQEELDLRLATTPKPRIVASHTPPFGLLDEAGAGNHIGHRPLRDFLLSPQGTTVELVLCGHVHEGFGLGRHGAAWVYNIAGGFVLLEDGPRGWQRKALWTFRDLMEEETLDESSGPD